MTNKWLNMPVGSQRRASTKKEIYWIKELATGRYGLRIDIDILFDESIKEIKLKNIDLIKVSSQSPNIISWVLLLKENEEHEIFQKLCEDLVDSSEDTKDDSAMITVIINRLKRWQKLFDRKLNRKLPFEVQMGLYSELFFLNEKLSNIVGVYNAIDSWVGPDFDLQDFIISDAVIEVKSYLTSKQESVFISNMHQLESPKENFYLAVLGLSKNSDGNTIDDLVKEIKSKLIDERDLTIIDIFEDKVFMYGYHELLHLDELDTFKIDKITFYKVDNEFPKLTSNSIPSEIVKVQYQIDLTKCSDFKIDISEMKIEV